MRILVIGVGNLGTHLIKRFVQKNQEVYIWHYDKEKMRRLGKSLKVGTIENLSLWKGDITFITVKDDSVKSVSKLVPSNVVKVHCSGALPMNELASSPRGVIYPLQSFVKSESVNWDEIPVFITYEDSSKEIVRESAEMLSPIVYEITDQKRLKIHLAAVIINNFINFTLGMAKKFMSREKLDLEWFMPLLNKTVERFKTGMDPLALQTGPARRHDYKTITKHLNLLRQSDDKTLYKFYKVLSDIISHYYEPEQKD